MHNEDDFERRLFAVNWSVYERVGFGSIPKTIVGLLGAKPAESSMWQDRLEFCLLPQASLGEGTPHALPFLLEALRERVAAEEIYTILVWVVICTEDGESGDLGRKCRDHILSGLDIYLRDLADTGLAIMVRSLALDVTCRLEEARVSWEPVVADVYKSESSSAMGAEIREWLEIGSAPTGPSGA